MAVDYLSEYENCNLCPRNCGVNRVCSESPVCTENPICGVNRKEGERGFCGETSELRIASAGLHFGEEPPITVLGGSGTIFITGCNLRCAFCQNYQISQNGMGREISREEFADICLKLQEEKAENINIVTGSHAIPFIAEALSEAKKRGLKIPVCWNSSAYENVDALEMLDGLVDIWLPDMKTLNPLVSDAVFKASDYPATCKRAIRWMINHAPLKFETVASVVRGDKDAERRFGGDTIEKMMGGVIIRHLVLPGRLDDTILVLDWLKKHADGKACISVMSQYTPVEFDLKEFESRKNALQCFQHRLMNNEEFERVQYLIAEYDFEYLFYQELTEGTDWLPDFEKKQPFSNELSRTIWHWKE